MTPSPFTVALVALTFTAALHAAPIASDYPSLQEAIDKNPGQIITVPSGDYPISSGLKIHTDNSGLAGPGRIILSDPKGDIIRVEGAANVQIRDLTLTRADGKMDAENSGLEAHHCPDLLVQNVQVLENRSSHPSFELEDCNRIRILNCSVRNYMCITVDDRTKSADWGYAFNAIDGTGIDLRDCVGALIQGNSVTETEFLPSPELKEKYSLGKFCKKNPQKGAITNQAMWNASYTNGWHQGSAITVATPETNDYIQILGNYIENAAQGLDIHGDHVIVSQNIVNNAFMGMKAMHGARNIIITNNQFSRNDLWAIGLMPGAASHAAGVSAHDGVAPADSPANVDGGSIIANNIISDFGYGTAHWMWKDATCAPLRFDDGQKPINPPLADVIIQGNIVYDTGRDKILENGKAVLEPPRYDYDVLVSTAPGGPKGLHFSNNLFHPGTHGVSNVELSP